MATKKAAKKVSPLKGRTKTPPFENYPAWSTARFFSFVRSALRSAYNRYPPKFSILLKARRPVEGKGNRKWEFKCASCGEWFPAKDVSVDHIVPAGALNKFEDLPGFVERLFCSEDNLQVLCTKECHRSKSNEERKKVD